MINLQNYIFIDLPMELPDGSSPLLSRLYTFHGPNFRNAVQPPLHRNVNSDSIGDGGEFGEVESVVAEVWKKLIFFLHDLYTTFYCMKVMRYLIFIVKNFL
jgi:hypothetical protein